MIPRPARLSRNEYADGILRADRAMLARAITLVESSLPEDEELAEWVLEECLPHSGKSIRIGITGVPGVGKSTFIEALGGYLTGERNETLAVLTIDPSSPISGGSILGDKTRMEKLARNERAFIRPSPSRGHLGGVTRGTREAILLCEAAGFRNIFVETVGVGQSEIAVRSLVDCFVLLMLAGAGDELQGIKRGLFELADIIAITKADGANEAAAALALQQYRSALHLFRTPGDGWRPAAITCSARTGQGITQIWDIVMEHRLHTGKNGFFQRRREEQRLEGFDEALSAAIRARLVKGAEASSVYESVMKKIRRGEVTPRSAARVALDQLTGIPPRQGTHT